MLSCKDNSSNVMKDEETIEKVTNYKLEYPSQDPGCEISYHHMWDGTDTKNMFGPNYSNENRLFTYLLNYEEETDDYYFVYVNKGSLSTITNWLEAYLESETSDNDANSIKMQTLLMVSICWARKRTILMISWTHSLITKKTLQLEMDILIRTKF